MDNIHSLDVARFIAAFAATPRCGEVYIWAAATLILVLSWRPSQWWSS